MTPLLRATLACICGLVPGLLAPATALPALLGALALVLGAVLAGVRSTRLLLLAFLLAGAAAGTGAGVRARTTCAARWTPDQRVALSGHFTVAPVEGRALRFQPAGGARCPDPVLVSLPREHPPVHAGEALRVRGTWQPFPPESGWPVAAERLGVLRASVVAAEPNRGAGSRLAGLRARAQLSLRRLLPRRHGVAEALVLARTEALEPGLRDTFVASGMAHLLAISGAHVVVFAGALLLLFRLARLRLLAGRVAALVLVTAYVAAIGAPPAAARAALQFVLVMAALLLQRPAQPWTLMAAAALALLIMQPLNALDAGFQLSFAGVAGLLAYRRPLLERLPARLPPPLRDGVATGIAATVATFPIAALHFGQFAPVGLVATLVATPVVTLALPGIALLILLDPAAPLLTTWLAPGIDLLLGVFLAVARAAAAVPAGHFAVASSTLTALLVAAAGVLLWLAQHRPQRPLSPPPSPTAARRRRTASLLRIVQAGAAAAALLAWTPGLVPGRADLELHFIDVGQGDAIAVRTPRGRWLLVDAGVRSERLDMGAKRVVPYLLRRGARQLDALILTHADGDHIGGAVSVLRAFRVAAVLDPGIPGTTAQYHQTLRAADAEPARWFTPRAGDQLAVDGVQLRFLHPAALPPDAAADPNDFCLVFRLTYGHFAALFTGDAPQRVEAALAASDGAGLAAAILKVGHHGSSTATSPALLDAASPRLAVISVGRDNRYGHPDPAVLARLLRHGVSVLRTDQHGSIVIRAWRSGIFQLGTSR